MTPMQSILVQLMKANHQKRGLKSLRLFRVKPAFFARLRREALDLARENAPSDVSNQYHVTNWTRPIGRAIQFSLLNTSGRFDDTSTDHLPALENKKFHHGARYPALGEFISKFPHAFNMRLNGMGPSGGLSKHKEHLYVYQDARCYQLRARFHLPVETNPSAEMYLDGDYYHFEAGTVFLFNNGCIHSAMNGGSSFRFHLVWDMLLTEESIRQMFFDEPEEDDVLVRVPQAEAQVAPLRRESIGRYEILTVSPLYRRLHLERLGLKPHQFENLKNEIKYVGMRTLKRPAPVDLNRRLAAVEL